MKNRRHGRWYGDGSEIAFGMELLGERWTALIIRELIYGPMRFSELIVELRNITAKVLAERLEPMIADGIICRRPQSNAKHPHTYMLTCWGQAAAPIVDEVARWAVRSSLYDKTLWQSCGSLMMLLKISFDTTAAKGLDMKVGLSAGRSKFVVDIKDKKIDIKKSEASIVDFQLYAPEPISSRSLIIEKTTLESTNVKLDGPKSRLQDFVEYFK